ncbi:MAG: nuclease-related domain-containing protein [Scytonema sp. PMC 1070.18]|nr:nuclease-related domain-containing protein [Scytonema sp. PMC 1070.18]
MSSRKAGHSIYQLGHKRLGNAIAYYFGAGTAVVVLVVLLPLLQFSHLGLFLYLGLGVGGYLLYLQGEQLRKKAARAYQGAAAEAEVGRLLKVLQAKGWQVEANVPVKGLGDLDFAIRSPSGHYFVVDTKSHKGTKIYLNGQLTRRYGRNLNPFKEGNLLEKVKRQARSLSVRVCKPVVAVLCFTQGEVDIPNGVADDVLVVFKDDLLSTLVDWDRKLNILT